MSPGSWEYYDRLIRYYGRGKGRPPGDDDDNPFGPDADGGLDPDALTLPGEPPGIWMGEGAEYLGLYGIVQEHDLAHIFTGYHPRTGIPLVQNAGTKHRQPGWDLTFSVPKSVSLCWAGGTAERREQIAKAVRTPCHSLEERRQTPPRFPNRHIPA